MGTNGSRTKLSVVQTDIPVLTPQQRYNEAIEFAIVHLRDVMHGLAHASNIAYLEIGDRAGQETAVTTTVHGKYVSQLIDALQDEREDLQMRLEREEPEPAA